MSNNNGLASLSPPSVAGQLASARNASKPGCHLSLLCCSLSPPPLLSLRRGLAIAITSDGIAPRRATCSDYLQNRRPESHAAPPGANMQERESAYSRRHFRQTDAADMVRCGFGEGRTHNSLRIQGLASELRRPNGLQRLHGLAATPWNAATPCVVATPQTVVTPRLALTACLPAILRAVALPWSAATAWVAATRSAAALRAAMPLPSGSWAVRARAAP